MVRLRHMTLAATNVDAMVAFYDGVLAADLQPIDGAPAGFHRGRLAGIDLVICPNEVAGVVAEQNRQQFCFEVDDIDAAFASAVGLGGVVIGDGPVSEAGLTRGALYDPDGNSIEFVQAG